MRDHALLSVVAVLTVCALPLGAQVHVVNVICCEFQDPANGNQSESFVVVGTTVQWVRISFNHSVTSGMGAADPLAGMLFNGTLNALSPTFSHTFTTVGTYPYFCLPHDPNMKGTVHVLPAASSTSIGAGCNASTGTPVTLTLPTPPAIGNLGFGFDVAGGPPGAQTFVYIAQLGVPIPLAGGCTVYLDLPTVVAYAQTGISPFGPLPLGPGGAVTFPVPLPFIPELGGITVALQAVVLDAGAPLGLALSNAVEMTVGM